MSDPNNPPPGQPQQWGEQPPPPSQPPQQQWGQQPPAPQQPPQQQWGQQPPAPGQPPQQQWGQQPPAPGQPPQQQWGQQPGQPPQQWGGQAPQGSGGLDPKIAALLAYFFGWLGGLIVYLTQKDREVRFHAAQSILLSIAIFAVYIAVAIVAAIFRPFGLLLIPVWLGAFALFIFMCIQGYNLKHFKLPVIGDMAEQWAAK